MAGEEEEEELVKGVGSVVAALLDCAAVGSSKDVELVVKVLKQLEEISAVVVVGGQSTESDRAVAQSTGSETQAKKEE